MRRETRVELNAVSDCFLAAAFQAGDHDAFAEIDRRFRPRLFYFLRARVDSQETAEDLTQETLFRAYSSLGSLRDGVFLAGWLKKIAYRVYVDWLRRSVRDSSRVSYDESGSVGESGEALTLPPSFIDPKRPSGGSFAGTSVDEAPALRDECDNLWRVAREVLSPIEFQVLWLRYEDELDDSETARSLGKSEGSVRTALSRARRRLSKFLKTADSKQ